MPKTKKTTSKADVKPASDVGASEEKKVRTEKSSKPVVSENKDTDKVTKKKEPAESTESDIKVLYCEKCNKLTTRGVGQLQYEIGIEEKSQEAFIRIVSSGSSGAFSKAWIKIEDIKIQLGDPDENGFRATGLSDLFKGRSTNNHGFLAAVLRHLNVFSTEAEQPTVLYFESWEPLMVKIEALKQDKDGKA